MMKRLLSLIAAAAMLIGCLSFTAYADGSNVTYSGNSGDLIFAPGSDHSPTDLFSDFKNVMPGASLTETITVSNMSDGKVVFYLRSLGSADPEFTEFLSQLTLTVRENTDTPLFDASADQTAGLTDWVCLGTLYSGCTTNINVTLDVPASLDNAFQNRIGEIRWQFVAEELPTAEPTWECPDGDGHSYHIEEIDGIAVYVCDDCGKTEPMKCEICGGNMRKAIAVTVGGQTYTAYHQGDNHYVTNDGNVHFYLNDDMIIDYYTVYGVRHDIKSVNEYKLRILYICLSDEHHHTDPHSPQTGDVLHIELWASLIAVGGIIVIILFFAKRRKHDSDGKVRA